MYIDFKTFLFLRNSATRLESELLTKPDQVFFPWFIPYNHPQALWFLPHSLNLFVFDCTQIESLFMLWFSFTGLFVEMCLNKKKKNFSRAEGGSSCSDSVSYAREGSELDLMASSERDSGFAITRTARGGRLKFCTAGLSKSICVFSISPRFQNKKPVFKQTDQFTFISVWQTLRCPWGMI